MAAPRPDPGRGVEEKPPRDAKSDPAPSFPSTRESRWKDWLPLGVALVAMPLLAYVTTTFVLVPRMQKALRPSHPAEGGATRSPDSPADASRSAHTEAAANPDTGVKPSATLNKLLVNVAGTMGSRYLLTSITLLGDTAEFTAQVAQHEAQLRDMASGILNTKTIADLEKPGARNLIRGELLAGFDTILGKSAIQEIYFTEFAIQ